MDLISTFPEASEAEYGRGSGDQRLPYIEGDHVKKYLPWVEWLDQISVRIHSNVGENQVKCTCFVLLGITWDNHYPELSDLKLLLNQKTRSDEA